MRKESLSYKNWLVLAAALIAVFALMFLVYKVDAAISGGNSDFSAHIQLSDGVCNEDPGEEEASGLLSSLTPADKDTESALATDDDGIDPDCIRVGVEHNDVDVSEKDFRVCLRFYDNLNEYWDWRADVAEWVWSGYPGEVKCTPWASDGGGWSGWAHDFNVLDYDGASIEIEKRDGNFSFPGGLQVVDVQLGVQLGNAGGCRGDFGEIVYTPWLRESANSGEVVWSDWATANGTTNPDCGRVQLRVEMGTPDTVDAGAEGGACSGLGPNLVKNGDFSQGNMYFSSDYSYVEIGSCTDSGALQPSEGRYGITTNPNQCHRFFAPAYSGNAMAVYNGSTNPDVENFWCQTIAIKPNTQYLFSVYARDANASAWNNGQRNIEPSLGWRTGAGNKLGTQIILPAQQLSSYWGDRRTLWTSLDQTGINLCGYTAESARVGNDWVLDDIRLHECPNCTVDNLGNIDFGRSECSPPSVPACNNGEDDDGDGLIDFSGGPNGEPMDPGCADENDNNEDEGAAQCSDGEDNDGNGVADFAGGDQGCSSPTDDKEGDPAANQCGDGKDNDHDGWVDMADPGCKVGDSEYDAISCTFTANPTVVVVGIGASTLEWKDCKHADGTALHTSLPAPMIIDSDTARTFPNISVPLPRAGTASVSPERRTEFTLQIFGTNYEAGDPNVANPIYQTAVEVDITTTSFDEVIP